MGEGPGPANYTTTKTTSPKDHVSHSKKGLGGFASKVRRFPQPWNNLYTVGPGQYNTESNGIRNDFNKANCTSNFHKPIAVNTEAKKFKTPAPNQYNVRVFDFLCSMFWWYVKSSAVVCFEQKTCDIADRSIFSIIRKNFVPLSYFRCTNTFTNRKLREVKESRN